MNAVALPGDPRHSHEGKSHDGAPILLRTTKAGRPQWVSVRDPLVVAFLRDLRRLVYGRGSNEYLFGSLRRTLLKEFARAQIELGFPVPIFVLHSLRHGGASFDFLTNVPIEKIIVHGRWVAIKVTRRYIQKSQARMLSMDIPAAVKRRIILLVVYLASERSVWIWISL